MVDFDPVKDLPLGSLAGKVYFITGGNAGIGFETVVALARAGARVFMGARSAEKASAAIDVLKSRIPSADCTHIPLDLLRPASIASAASTFLSLSSRLDCLVNNAGIMMTPFEIASETGLESQFATNFFGHFYLTQLLLPALRRSDGRVVDVSSVGHQAAPWGLPKDLDDVNAWERKTTMERYGISKLANIYHASELTRREAERPLVDGQTRPVWAVSLHPGLIFTELYAPFGKQLPPVGWAVALAKKVWWVDEVKGSLNSLWAATVDEDLVKKGGYYVPVGTDGDCWWDWRGLGRWGKREAEARRLWEWAAGTIRENDEGRKTGKAK